MHHYNKFTRYITILLFICFHTCHSQVLILTCCYNRPDFIEIQFKTFKKFLRESFKFIVINDAPTQDVSQEIEKMCKKYDIECKRFEQHWHNLPYLPRNDGNPFNFPSVRHAHALQYGLQTIGFSHDDYVMIADSDLFLVKPFSVTEYMQDHHISGFLRYSQFTGSLQEDTQISYFWPPLIIINMPILPNKIDFNVNVGFVAPDRWVDTGGFTYFYMKNNPHLKIKFLNIIGLNAVPNDLHLLFTLVHSPYYTQDQCKDVNLLRSLKFDDDQINFITQGPINIQYFLNNKFIHYMSASNYDKKSSFWHELKTSLFNNYISKLLST